MQAIALPNGFMQQFSVNQDISLGRRSDRPQRPHHSPKSMANTGKPHQLSINRVITTLLALAICSLVGCFSLGFAKKLPPATASLITMPPSQSQAIPSMIQHIVERQANAWETADSDKIIADFAEDSLFIVPGSTLKGHQEIKEAAESYFAEFTETQVTIKRIIANGNEVAVEWSWSEKNKKTGETSKANDAIIFELKNGKIKYWREYIDKESQKNSQ